MGPISDNMGPLWATIMGPRWVLQMTLAWVPRGFTTSRMGPTWDLFGTTLVPHDIPLWGPYRFSKRIWHGSHMGSAMGPTWDLSGATWVPCRLPIWGHMGFVNYWSHMGYHYGTQTDFANDFGMGTTPIPTLVQIGDLSGTNWAHMGWKKR